MGGLLTLNDYKEIPLTRGFVAIVDTEDYERLSKQKWNYHSKGYAIAYNPETKRQELMHRAIISPDSDMTIDHINRNGLDNRKCNLRVCTRAENVRNTSSSRGKSKYKGVSYREGLQKPWRTRIYHNGTEELLGYFYTEEEAASVYNHRAKELFGEYAFLNDVISN